MQIGESISVATGSSGSSSDTESAADEDVLELVLHDACFRRLRGAEYEVDYGGSTSAGRADGAGVVRLTLRQGVERCAVRWGRRGDGSWAFAREVHVGEIDPGSGEGRDKLLHNLGFVGDQKAPRVQGFQTLAAIDPSGDEDAATLAALARIARNGRVVLDPVGRERANGGHRT